MKIRGGQEKEQIKLQTTAMIDIVFQLLVFFIMTFKITALEGDFQVNMPQASDLPQTPIENIDKTIRIHLYENPQAIRITYLNADGKEVTRDVRNTLQSIEVNHGDRDPVTFSHLGKQYDAFKALRDHIQGIIESEADPSQAKELEVEFEVDPNLIHGDTVRAVEAVSARIGEDRTIIPMIEKIKFKDTGAGAGE